MPEKHGVETLKKVAEAVADVLNVGSKVLNKQGLWHLISLKDSVEFFTKVDLRVVLVELKDGNEADRESVESAFKAKLDLVNKDVQAKFGTFVDTLEEVADLAEDAYSTGVALYERTMKLVTKVRSLLGV